MTTATKTRRKPRRDVTETAVPTRIDGKGNVAVDFAAVLLAALTVPGQMSKCYNRFHRYSFLNMLLVFIQTGQLEPMGTFNKWKSLGRKVISGPGSALFVNHPRPVYKRDAAGNTIKGDDGKPIVAFVLFEPKPTVFQLFQTEGPELEFPDTPDWNLDAALKVLDIKQVSFRSQDGNTQGYSRERNVAVSKLAEAPMKTMIHEIAHIILGHTTKDQLAEYQLHRGVKEFQAEAVSLLVCRELGVEGFDESASRAYIQTWLGSGTTDYLDHDEEIGDAVLAMDSTVREIFSTTDKILVAGRKKHWDKLQEQDDVA